MCWTALRTSDSSDGIAVARVLNPQSKNKKVMVACLILILAFNRVAIAPGTDLVGFMIVDNLAAHLGSITEKPCAGAQRSNNERRRQIVSPKKNRRGD
jgi:hypothetical protein